MKSLTLSALIASSLALTGCASLLENSDKALKPLLKLGNEFCKEAPSESRKLLKEEKVPAIIEAEDYDHLDAEKFKTVEFCKD